MNRNSHKMRRGTLRIIAWPAFANKHNNPFQFLLYSRMAALGAKVVEATPVAFIARRYNIFHVHWPDILFQTKSVPKATARAAAFIIVLGCLKLRGTKIVWTVHNLIAHETEFPLLARLFWRAFVYMLDGFISLSKQSVVSIVARYPALGTVPHAVIPHGHYRDYYENTVSRGEARKRLGLPLSSKVVLFLGMIRPYKKVPSLIEAFKNVSVGDYRLIIAGHIPKAVERQVSEERLRRLTAGDSRIGLNLGHVEDRDMQIYLNAADLVVLPFSMIFHSGSAILALSFNRPVLVPNKGSMGELQQMCGEDWVHLYDGTLRAEDIVTAMESTQNLRPSTRMLEAMDWDRIARLTRRFFNDISS